MCLRLCMQTLDAKLKYEPQMRTLTNSECKLKRELWIQTLECKLWIRTLDPELQLCNSKRPTLATKQWLGALILIRRSAWLVNEPTHGEFVSWLISWLVSANLSHDLWNKKSLVKWFGGYANRKLFDYLALNKPKIEEGSESVNLLQFFVLWPD